MQHDDDAPDKQAFNPNAAFQQMAGASAALAALLKAKREAMHSTSTREFAVKSLRGIEPIILELFDEGVSIHEVVVLLTTALPDIPHADIAYGIRMLRKHRSVRLRTTSPRQAAVAPAQQMSGNSQAHLPPVQSKRVPDEPVLSEGSDRRPDETWEDYCLRREIEGSSL